MPKGGAVGYVSVVGGVVFGVVPGVAGIHDAVTEVIPGTIHNGCVRVVFTITHQFKYAAYTGGFTTTGPIRRPVGGIDGVPSVAGVAGVLA